MAMADRDGVYGAPRFHMAMNKAGMRAHIGSEITFAPRRHTQERVIGRSDDHPSRPTAGLPGTPGDRVIKTPTQITRSPDHQITRLPLLVANREGYQNLCRLVTRRKRICRSTRAG
jgi:error-prone DNA polymerase